MSTASAVVWAEARAASDVAFRFEGRTLAAHLEPGLHFNADAPNLAMVVATVGAAAGEASLKPTRLAGRDASFEFPSADFASARVALYVCDDANTRCDPRVFEIGPGGKLIAEKDGLQPSAPAGGAAAPAPSKMNEHGFLEGGVAQAIAEAKKTGRPALLDFSARWCPGCVRLETEGFPSPEFRAAAKGLAKARVDVDRLDMAAIKKSYDVHAIPALLLVDGEGREIARLVDYQPPVKLAEFLKDGRKTPLALDALRAKAGGGDRRAARLAGRRLYASGRFKDAIPYLEFEKPQPIELLDARVELAREDLKADVALEPKFAKALRAAIAGAPASTLALKWRADLAALKSITAVERAALAKEGFESADRMLAAAKALRDGVRGDNVGEYEGLERLYVADLKTSLASASEQGEAVKAEIAAQETAIGEALGIPPSRRGPSLRLLVVLAGRKQWAKAEARAKAMLALAPHDPEVERRLARVLREQGKNEEAIAVGESSRAASYGLNEYWSSIELARAYAGAGRKDEARALLKGLLARPEVNEENLKSEKEALEKALAAADEAPAQTK